MPTTMSMNRLAQTTRFSTNDKANNDSACNNSTVVETNDKADVKSHNKIEAANNDNSGAYVHNNQPTAAAVYDGRKVDI